VEYIRQRTDNQNIQRAQKTKLPKINEPIKKCVTKLHRTFSKEEIPMSKKHMKKCSPFVRIKTTLRFHPSPVKWLSSRTPTTTNVGEDAGEKGTLIHCWWECKLVQPLWKTI
jgi:hypothetical protein